MKLSLFSVVVVAAAMTVAACGGSSNSGGPASSTGPATSTATGSTTTTAGAASGDPSAVWVDQMCSELAQLMQTVMAVQSDRTFDNAQLISSVRQEMDRNVTAVDQALSGLKANGPSPIVGGDLMQSSFILVLERLRTNYQAVGDLFATVRESDQQGVQAAIDSMLTVVNQASEELSRVPLALMVNTAVDDIAEDTASCQLLSHPTTSPIMTS